MWAIFYIPRNVPVSSQTVTRCQVVPGVLLAAFPRGAQMEVRPSVSCRVRQVMVQSYQVTQGCVCLSRVCV